jgi:hypothetical protein
VLWQHVFQAVVCVLSAVQRATATLITMYFYWLILQKRNFSKDQRKLPYDGPEGPKHVEANIEIF